MLVRRRPIRGRSRCVRRLRREINFPQLRKEISYVSKAGLILNQSDYLSDGQLLTFLDEELNVGNLAK
jgi:hypothetical protein